MRSRAIVVVASFVAITSGICLAQSMKSRPDNLLARLSYRGADIVDWRYQKDYPQVCLALYRNGYYRISRMTEGGTEALQGTLPDLQFARIDNLLKRLDFSSNEGGIVRQRSESLVAEIVRDGEIRRYVWVDPDHLRPFPESAVRVVKWLQNFKAQGAAPVTLRELSDAPICPPASAKPIQPVVAGLNGISDQ